MTTSETGDPGGFTLLEILLALALIALLGTIFIGGSEALLSDKAKSLDEQFWQACIAARRQALEDRKNVVVSYDPKVKGFIFSEGAAKVTVPVKGPEDLVIDFHSAQPSSISESLIGGTAVETEPITSVTFYNDGTCTPFRAQIRANGAAHVLSIDPWTCAQVLTLSDAKS
jgi:prepilin-type N-terminal cleavage/methylation domain-containing protein